MKIDERIFNEMTDASYKFEDVPANEEFNENVLPDLIDHNDDDDIINLWHVDYNSLLYRGLLKWYGSATNLADQIRAYTEDEDKAGFYFVTGAGYDIISSDLLNGPANGQPKINFLKIINNED